MRDSGTGSAQFIRQPTVVYSSGYDHASDAQRRYTLSRNTPRRAIPNHAAFQYANHGAKYCLEGAPGSCAASRHIRGQSNHGAGVLNVLEMLS